MKDFEQRHPGTVNVLGWTTPRMGSWMLITLGLLVVVYFVAPQQLAVDVHKLSLVTLGGWVGYGIDRCAFPFHRPHDLKADIPLAAAMLRRAVLMAGAMLAASMGG